MPPKESKSQQLAEQPPAYDAFKDGEPIPQRTVEQQNKAENFRAQQARENNEVSNRSRSQSRRDRRKRIRGQQDDGKFMKTNSLEALEEADANGEMHAMQPFSRIGPDSTSMDGPVTHARAMRGEIPVRGTNAKEPYYVPPEQQSKDMVSTLQCCWVITATMTDWQGLIRRGSVADDFVNLNRAH